MPLLAIIVPVTQVELIKVIWSMNYRVTCVVASVRILLHRVKIVVASVVRILAISSTKVIIWALKRANRTMVRPNADLWRSWVSRSPIMITAMHLMSAASTNDMRRSNTILIIERRSSSWRIQALVMITHMVAPRQTVTVSLIKMSPSSCIAPMHFTI